MLCITMLLMHVMHIALTLENCIVKQLNHVTSSKTLTLVLQGCVEYTGIQNE